MKKLRISPPKFPINNLGHTFYRSSLYRAQHNCYFQVARMLQASSGWSGKQINIQNSLNLGTTFQPNSPMCLPVAACATPPWPWGTFGSSRCRRRGRGGRGGRGGGRGGGAAPPPPAARWSWTGQTAPAAPSTARTAASTAPVKGQKQVTSYYTHLLTELFVPLKTPLYTGLG